MSVTARSNTSANLAVGDVWCIDVSVAGPDGCWTSEEPTVTITLPDGTTDPAPVTWINPYVGRYLIAYLPAAPGRYLAQVATLSSGSATFTAYATALVDGTGMPDLIDLRGDPDAEPPTVGYLEENSWSDEELQDALDAEAAAQRVACDVPAAYPADLRQALLRRVWRNLAMRGQPFLTVPGGEDGQVSVVPGLDAEIRRFERPWRRLVMG
jgi:hypothetical protein